MQTRLHIFVVDERINVLFYGSRVPLKSYCCTHYISISPLTAFFTLSCSVSHPASWRIPGVFIVVLFSAMCFINNAVRYYGLSRDAGSRRGKLKPFSSPYRLVCLSRALFLTSSVVIYHARRFTGRVADRPLAA